MTKPWGQKLACNLTGKHRFSGKLDPIRIKSRGIRTQGRCLSATSNIPGARQPLPPLTLLLSSPLLPFLHFFSFFGLFHYSLISVSPWFWSFTHYFALFTVSSFLPLLFLRILFSPSSMHPSSLFFQLFDILFYLRPISILCFPFLSPLSFLCHTHLSASISNSIHHKWQSLRAPEAF